MYLEGLLFNEIKSFYYIVRNEGIIWSKYVEHKRYLKTKIDDTVKAYLNLNDILWLQNRITKDQYCGTGKSYLLKCFKEHTNKDVLYTAPTGIAAINIGVVTIHSAFGFDNLKDGTKYFKLSYEKIDILRNLEVLIIDEILMVRVDVLEQINKILQFYNCTDKPFGGKQVIVFPIYL